MGNSWGRSTTEPESTQVSHHQQEQQPAFDVDMDTPFQRTPDLMARGAVVEDRKLGSLLEFFKQLRSRREDIFKRVITVHNQELEDIFEKMDKNRTDHDNKMRGAVITRQRSISFGHGDEVRLSRFKVKPIDSGGKGTPPSGGGGGGDKGGPSGGKTKPGGSK